MNRSMLAAGPVAVVAAAGALLLYDPFADHVLQCPSQAVGITCPGCGGTRAAWLLLHGDVTGAVQHNLLLFPFLAYVAARWLHDALPAAAGWLPTFVRQPEQVSAGAMRLLAVLLVAFTVARNLPPLAFLAPA